MISIDFLNQFRVAATINSGMIDGRILFILHNAPSRLPSPQCYSWVCTPLSTSAPLDLHDLYHSLGPLLIGVLLNTMLYGVSARELDIMVMANVHFCGTDSDRPGNLKSVLVCPPFMLCPT